MTEGTTRDGSIQTLPLAIGAVLGIAGVRLLLIGGQVAISGGVLLAVGAIAAAGVAFGGRADGASVEAQPDLSSRIGLGLLGGVLAGLLHGTLTLVASWWGAAALLGAGIDIELSALDWLSRAALGGLLGIGFGIVYPLMAGESFIGKGAWAGLLLAAWQLFYVYPFRLGLGLAGIDAGWAVAPLVVVGAVIAGVAAAWLVAWGGRQRDEPLSAPLVP